MTHSKPAGKPDYAREREEMAKRPERQTKGQAPSRKTSPPANQKTDGGDLDRGVEKLEGLVGR